MLNGERYQLEISPAMLTDNPPIQIIIAALNEEKGIASTIDDLKQVLINPNIIVIDGKSTDKTPVVARTLGAQVISQKDSGKGEALNSGLRLIDPSTKYVVLTDADYTYPAQHIPEMVRIIEQNPQVGMVCGNRFNQVYKMKTMNRIFYYGNQALSNIHNVLNGINLKDPLTGLRVVRADLMRTWHPQSKNFDIEVELNSYVAKSGFETIEIPISYRERIGEKKLRVKHGRIILQRILLEFFGY